MYVYIYVYVCIEAVEQSTDLRRCSSFFSRQVLPSSKLKLSIFQKLVFKHKIFPFTCLPSFVIEKDISALGEDERIITMLEVFVELPVRNRRWSFSVLHAVETTSCVWYGTATIDVSMLSLPDTAHECPGREREKWRKRNENGRCRTSM